MFEGLFIFMVSFGLLLIFSIVACEIVDSLTSFYVEKEEKEWEERVEALKNYLEHIEELYYPSSCKKDNLFYRKGA